jgi:hypothetical protein
VTCPPITRTTVKLVMPVGHAKKVVRKGQSVYKPTTEPNRTEGAPAGPLNCHRRKKTSWVRAGLFAPLRDLVAGGSRILLRDFQSVDTFSPGLIRFRPVVGVSGFHDIAAPFLGRDASPFNQDAVSTVVRNIPLALG